MLKTIAICLAFVAWPAPAADARSFDMVGAAGEAHTRGAAKADRAGGLSPGKQIQPQPPARNPPLICDQNPSGAICAP